MLASEIDDIFAGKSTGKKIPTADSSILTGKKKKKKRKNKDNKTESTQEHVSSETSKSKKSSEAVIEGASKLDGKKRKRTPPQEIVDPSLPAAKKRQKVEQAVGSSSKKKTERDDMKKFKDSRGSSGSEYGVFRDIHLQTDSPGCREADRRGISDLHRRRTGLE